MFGNFIVFANMVRDNQLSKTDTTDVCQRAHSGNMLSTTKRQKGEKKERKGDREQDYS